MDKTEALYLSRLYDWDGFKPALFSVGSPHLKPHPNRTEQRICLACVQALNGKGVLPPALILSAEEPSGGYYLSMICPSANDFDLKIIWEICQNAVNSIRANHPVTIEVLVERPVPVLPSPEISEMYTKDCKLIAAWWKFWAKKISA